jgi:hypothetical protein
MKKFIITTTINKPTIATLKFIGENCEVKNRAMDLYLKIIL